MLPAGVKEELNFIPSGVPGERRAAKGPADEALAAVTEESFRSACDSSEGAAQGPPNQQRAHRSKAHILGQLWDEEVESRSSVVTMYKDPSAQASFALDAALERHGRTPQGIVGSGYRGEETADFMGLEAETLPEYCSFESTSYQECSDSSRSGGSYHSQSDPAVEPRGAGEADSGGSADSTPCRGEYAEWTRGDRPDDFGTADGLKNEEFHSMMEEVPLDPNSAAWVSSWTPTPQGLETDPRSEAGWSCPEHDFERRSSGTDSSLAVLYDSRSVTESPQVTVSQAVDVSGDFRASYTSTRATEARWSMSNRSCNTEARATKNAAVNTGCALSARDRGTQTTSAPTADKYAITEVYMSDLDYFTEVMSSCSPA